MKKPRLGICRRSPVLFPKRGAFTSLELLLAAALVAVLISLLFAALGAARNITNRTKCVANLRTIGASLGIYMQEHRGEWPYVGDPDPAHSQDLLPAAGPNYCYDNIYNPLIGWRGVGALYRLGGLPKASLFCPADKERSRILTRSIDWENPPFALISSYSVRGARQFDKGNADSKEFGRKLADVSSTAIISCLFRYQPNNPVRHPLSFHTGYRYPVLFGDGHVGIAGLPPGINPASPPVIDGNFNNTTAFWTHFDKTAQ